MKTKARLSLFFAVGLAASAVCQAAFAQERPTPAQTPAAAPAGKVQTFVYLKQDYVDALHPSGIVRDNPLTAVFVRFDNDFVVFRRPESPALIYIPKTAVLYISAKPPSQVMY